jgi:predicted metal-dependent phosphoesterase TrpH
MHSTYSDGKYTPAELVEKAKLIGLQTIAITDHDNLGGIAEAKKFGKQQ